MPIHLNPTIQPPLSRRGTGPGLVLLVHGASPQSSNWEKTLDPPPVQKWAEEGFAVVELRQVTIEDAEEDGFTAVESALQQAVSNLMDCKNCEINGKEGEGVGFICRSFLRIICLGRVFGVAVCRRILPLL
ncbi:hypothetical protein GQ43DRAFT_441800 [Delitschia confertaspora ATCC 74209]|uniref:Uncharacterized protein n=1 Tax=Delitschia confertaspora ATCC 74209 TaxID=1513339 RepID=A0A9P4JJF5_9PLEO|nr:hypothetical protein GQ43DRAFT_441800 [Delitschia confertaspora ATCC 74209]